MATPALHTPCSFVSSGASQASNPSFAQRMISNFDLVLFTESRCRNCAAARLALRDVGIRPTVVDLDVLEDGADIREELELCTRQRSLPYVFLKGKHFGGLEELLGALNTQALRDELTKPSIADEFSAVEDEVVGDR
eukprot:CAMPEP_0185192292 /NCGR_PEP_ID=MMETSP1140-20130426/17851_1 /TAXON_ID=298111 /ORGANISM="Pavlova sp., Strain CCMP459" /LENGTH=136 /DNA_ID=CAMNT_0027759031 /DNA_START=31 /DNA_END=441 /DNA_ORIENTATION=-